MFSRRSPSDDRIPDSIPSSQNEASEFLGNDDDLSLSLPSAYRKYVGFALNRIFKTDFSKTPKQLQEAYWSAVSAGFGAYLEAPAYGIVKICNEGEIIGRIRLSPAQLAAGEWEEPVATAFAQFRAADLIEANLEDFRRLAQRMPGETACTSEIEERLALIVGLVPEDQARLFVVEREYGLEISYSSGEEVYASILRGKSSGTILEFSIAQSSDTFLRLRPLCF